MDFLPLKEFELSTNLSLTQVTEKITSNTITVKQESFKQYKKLFKGLVFKNSFKISRELSYRNSFKAHIFGEINRTETGSLVKIAMKLQPEISVFLKIWCGFSGFGFVAFLIASFNNPKIILGSLISLVMLAFCYGLTKISFDSDADQSKRILIDLLEAKEQL